MASRMPPPEITLRDDQYINDDAMKTRISGNSVVVIDVRDDGEIQQKGKIDCPRWINIPWDQIDSEFLLPDADFKTKYGVDKPATPGAEIVVHCRTGRKASHAFTTLLNKGYDQTKSLKGGYCKWTNTEPW